MKHFCYISSFSLYTIKTQSAHYQQHTQKHRNLPKLKKMALKQNYTPQKRDFGREKVLFSPSLPLKSLRNTGAEQSSIVHCRPHCVRFFRRKTRLFSGATLFLLSARRLWAKTPLLFTQNRPLFAKSRLLFSLGSQEGKERRLRYAETT